MNEDTKQIISLEPEAIRTKIHSIRGQQVMLDKDIAALYEVKPIRLNDSDVDFMVSQNAIPSRKHLGSFLSEFEEFRKKVSLNG